MFLYLYSVVISKAIALAGHGGDHPLLLVFEKGDMIHITSKSAGKNPLLWGGEVSCLIYKV